MSIATLTKWGNSQGITIPKTICDSLGLSIGDKIAINTTDTGTIELSCATRKFARTKKLTLDEIFAGWSDEYTPPADYASAANEIDWGKPVGKEMW